MTIRTVHWGVCDYQVGEGCASVAGDSLQAMTVKALRALLTAEGWHRVDGRLDCCPWCWPRRVRYHAGRRVGA